MDDYSALDLERDYYLGSYQTCINKANLMPASPDSIYYLCLSYKAANKLDNLDREVDKSIGKYLDDDDSAEWTFLRVLKGEQVTAEQEDDRSRILMSATLACKRDFVKALKTIHHLDSLRAYHARITVYIMMHRLDLAEKELNKMQKKDEQNPLTELSNAIVLLANGNPTQAWRLALSLSERYRPTPLLNNLQTASALCLSDYDSAKQLCEGSLDMDNDNVEALINMVHILSKSRTPTQAALIERNLERLRDLNPDHEYLKELGGLAAEMAA